TADPLPRFWAAAWAYVDATAAGDFGFAERCLSLERAMSARLHEPTLGWGATLPEAVLAPPTGEADRAEEFSAAALEVGSSSAQPDAFAFYGAQLMCVRDQQGRLAELVGLIADVAAQNPGMPVYKATLAWAHHEAGDEATARELFALAAREAFALPMDS